MLLHHYHWEHTPIPGSRSEYKASAYLLYTLWARHSPTGRENTTSESGTAKMFGRRTSFAQYGRDQIYAGGSAAGTTHGLRAYSVPRRSMR